MPRGYRLAIVAAFGCLIAASPPNDHSGGKHYAYAQAERHKSIAAPAKLEPPPDANNAKSTAKGCEGTANPKLSCEAISAQASYDQARSANNQVIISLVQTAFVGLALLAAGFAAWYAREAAKHTASGSAEAGRSVRIARQALDHSQDISRAQIRPYIGIEAIEIKLARYGGRQALVCLKNYGQTPSQSVTIRIVVGYLAGGQEGTGVLPQATMHFYGTINPGQSILQYFDVSDTAAGVELRSAQLVVRFGLEYTVPGGSADRRAFMYSCPSAEIDSKPLQLLKAKEIAGVFNPSIANWNATRDQGKG